MILGFAYCLELLMLAGQGVLYIGYAMTDIFQTPVAAEPAWWFLSLVLCVGINLRPRLFFGVNAALTAVSTAILLIIFAIQVKFVDFGAAFDAVPEAQSRQFSSWFLPFGLSGVAEAIPAAMFLYVGFEGLLIRVDSTHGVV
ncbi:hypothetical protein HK105_208285 [Polyrhizophydium stewartii]|uniref:Uncharacterized protein n=1 Tax=Polyrhizophydium stewartii TaxID=2732419 RepID=A0ABR4MY62_9FUNG